MMILSPKSGRWYSQQCQTTMRRTVCHQLAPGFSLVFNHWPARHCYFRPLRGRYNEDTKLKKGGERSFSEPGREQLYIHVILSQVTTQGVFPALAGPFRAGIARGRTGQSQVRHIASKSLFDFSTLLSTIEFSIKEPFQSQ